MPASGCSKPAMSRSTVVFPEPDGPSIEKNSPSQIVEIDAVDGRDRPEAAGETTQVDGELVIGVRHARTLLSEMSRVQQNLGSGGCRCSPSVPRLVPFEPVRFL